MLALLAFVLTPSPSVAVFCPVAAVRVTVTTDDAGMALASAREGRGEVTTPVGTAPRTRSSAERRGSVTVGLPLLASLPATPLHTASVTPPHAVAVRTPSDRRHARLMVFLN